MSSIKISKFMAVKISKILTRNEENIPYDSPKSYTNFEFKMDKVELELFQSNNISVITTELINNNLTRITNFYFKDKETALTFLVAMMYDNELISERLDELAHYSNNNIKIEWKIDYDFPLELPS
jgi:hypothetical protein